MATAKVIGKIENVIGSAKIVSADGTFHDAVVGGFLYEGEQIISMDESTVLSVKYLALPDEAIYNGVFRVLADGSVIAGADALDSIASDENLVELVATAAGEQGVDGGSAFTPYDVVANSSVLGFDRSADDGVGLGTTVLGDNATFGDDTTAPDITSGTFVIFDENSEEPIIKVVASDTSPVTFSLAAGLDSALFNIDPISGILRFNAPPDFENPLDIGGDNQYNVSVIVTDSAGNSSTQLITVGINNLNDNAPIVEDAATSATEDVPADVIGQLVGTDADGNALEFQLVEGLEAGEGSLVLNPDGSYTYNVGGDFQDLAFGQTREVTFTYQASEVAGSAPTEGGPYDSNIATVTITVTGTNDQPVVSNITVGESHSYGGENWYAEGNGLLIVGYENDGSVVTPILHSGGLGIGSGLYEDPQVNDQLIGQGGHSAEAIEFQFDKDYNTATVELTSFNRGFIFSTTEKASWTAYNNGVEVDSGTFYAKFGSDIFTIHTDSDFNSIRIAPPLDWQNDSFYIKSLDVSKVIYESHDNEFYQDNMDNTADDVSTFVMGTLPEAQDVDVIDTHTYHIVDGSVSVDNPEQPSPATVVVNSDGTFGVSGDFNYLAAGETVSVTFEYVAVDSSGVGVGGGTNEPDTSAPATVTVIITGTNDQPIVTDIAMGQSSSYGSDNWFDEGNGLTIVGYENNGSVVTPILHNDGLGIGTGRFENPEINDQIGWHGRTAEAIEFQFDKDYNTATVELTSFNRGFIFPITEKASWTAYNDGVEVDSGTFYAKWSASDIYTIHTDADFDSLRIEPPLDWQLDSFYVKSLSVSNLIYESHDNAFYQDGLDNTTDDVSTFVQGTLAGVQDADVTDTHTYHIVDGSVSVDNPEQPSPPTVVVHGDGTFGVGGDFNYLATGESATVTFQYYAEDSRGFGATGDAYNEASQSEYKTVSVTITGTNDQPIVYDVNVNNNSYGSDNWFDEGNGLTIVGYENDGSIVTPILHSEGLGIGTGRFENPEINDQLFGQGGRTAEAIEFRFTDDYNSATVELTGLKNGEKAAWTAYHGAEIVDSGTLSAISGPDIFNIQTLLAFDSIRIEPPLDWHNDSFYIKSLDVSKVIYESDSGLNENVFSGQLSVTDADFADTHTFHIAGAQGDGAVAATVTDDSGLNLGLSATVQMINPATGEFQISGDFNALTEGEHAEVTFSYYAVDNNNLDGSDGVNESSTSELKTVTMTITGTNDAPIAVSEIITKVAEHVMTEGGTVPIVDVDALVPSTSVYEKNGWYGIDTPTKGGGDEKSHIDSKSDSNEGIGFTFASDVTQATVGFRNIDNNDNISVKLYSDGNYKGDIDTSSLPNGRSTLTINPGYSFDEIKIYALDPSHGNTEFKVSAPVSTTEGSENTYLYPFIIDDLSLLANDSDIDGNHLQIQLGDGILYDSEDTPIGTVTINSEGNIQVTPDLMYEVTDDSTATFTYSVVDEFGAVSNVATATIDVAVGEVVGTGGDAVVSYEGTASDDIIIGTDANDAISGGEGNDMLDGGAGSDALYGGAGNDVLNYDAADSVIDGGAGTDTVLVASGTLDLSHVSNIEVIQLDSDSTLVGTNPTAGINAADVISATGDTNTLIIESVDDGVPNSVHVDTTSLTQGANVDIDGIQYAQFSDGTATLLIDIDDPITVV